MLRALNGDLPGMASMIRVQEGSKTQTLRTSSVAYQYNIYSPADWAQTLTQDDSLSAKGKDSVSQSNQVLSPPWNPLLCQASDLQVPELRSQ